MSKPYTFRNTGTRRNEQERQVSSACSVHVPTPIGGGNGNAHGTPRELLLGNAYGMGSIWEEERDLTSYFQWTY